MPQRIGFQRSAVHRFLVKEVSLNMNLLATWLPYWSIIALATLLGCTRAAKQMTQVVKPKQLSGDHKPEDPQVMNAQLRHTAHHIIYPDIVAACADKGRVSSKVGSGDVRGWRNTVEIILFEISNSMKPYPSVFHAYANELRLVMAPLEPNTLDEASNRVPPTPQGFQGWPPAGHRLATGLPRAGPRRHRAPVPRAVIHDPQLSIVA